LVNRDISYLVARKYRVLLDFTIFGGKNVKSVSWANTIHKDIHDEYVYASNKLMITPLNQDIKSHHRGLKETQKNYRGITL